MGDLEELAATRGRLWFWIVYARTLISLGWRTGGAAFIFAFAIIKVMFGRVIPWLMNHQDSHMRDARLFRVHNLHVSLIFWSLSLTSAQVLIFALPFVLVRFGLRDRLTQLICALFVIALPLYSFRPWLMDLSSLLALVALAAALLVRQWRRPTIVLAGMGITAVGWKLPFLISTVYRRHVPTLSNFMYAMCEATAFAISAAVCIYLHRWLLRDRPASNSTLAETQ
jgi:hypothetical protein